MAKDLTLKKFIKYFDSTNELFIYDWNIPVSPVLTKEQRAEKCLLFKGYTFDKGVKKKLKALYEEGYILERNSDGCAVMLFPYVNEYGAKLCKVQINVRKPVKEDN